jgi:hypothetical protein
MFAKKAVREKSEIWKCQETWLSSDGCWGVIGYWPIGKVNCIGRWFFSSLSFAYTSCTIFDMIFYITANAAQVPYLTNIKLLFAVVSHYKVAVFPVKL